MDTYPLDHDLYGGDGYPLFEQLAVYQICQLTRQIIGFVDFKNFILSSNLIASNYTA